MAVKLKDLGRNPISASRDNEGDEICRTLLHCLRVPLGDFVVYVVYVPYTDKEGFYKLLVSPFDFFPNMCTSEQVGGEGRKPGRADFVQPAGRRLKPGYPFGVERGKNPGCQASRQPPSILGSKCFPQKCPAHWKKAQREAEDRRCGKRGSWKGRSLLSRPVSESTSDLQLRKKPGASGGRWTAPPATLKCWLIGGRKAAIVCLPGLDGPAGPAERAQRRCPPACARQLPPEMFGDYVSTAEKRDGDAEGDGDRQRGGEGDTETD
ncbi:uncharacterized protein LOC127541716 [Antechinus flavipes]|uniref:uncharacterized protein LOC127541716 n=1 Tax=Antechinus flavipes TaxID=38775 RepID=UPI00223604EE|nr:uncharacterized protein LOC127541716 [Antechinus flavipes]